MKKLDLIEIVKSLKEQISKLEERVKFLESISLKKIRVETLKSESLDDWEEVEIEISEEQLEELVKFRK